MMRIYFKQLHSLQRALLFVLFAQLFTLTMMAEEVFVDGIKYDIVKKAKQATVIANSYSGDVVIPSSVMYDNVEYSVTAIGNTAFIYCWGLRSVTIPNSIISIGFAAFYGCSALTSVIIPESVISIGSSVFTGCKNLTSVTIPNSVTSIVSVAFSGCSGLTSVTIPNSVTNIEHGAFSGCSGLTSVTIPNSVTSIGSSAFSGCSGLTSLTIGNSVTSIQDNAFANCGELMNVYCLATNVPTAVSTAFDGSYPEYITLHVPEEAVENYRSTAPWSSFGTILPLPLVGDANGNGEVEIGDVTSVLTLMATPEATGYDNKAADANGNGEIEIGDVTTILTIMAGN